MDRVKVAIAGATGVVGQFFVSLLHNHPFLELTMLAASASKKGLRYGDSIEQWIPNIELPSEIAEMKLTDNVGIIDGDVDIVFSALPKDIAAELEPKWASVGKIVVSNSSNFRLEEDVPLLNPEVNIIQFSLVKRQRIRRKWKGAIIKNPNCTTAILTLTLKPLLDEYGIKRVFVTTMQAISGAGLKGHYAMELFGNVIPFIQNEEDKIISESRKILGELREESVVEADISIYPTAARVPVLVGHTESVVVELHKAPDDQSDIKRLLENWRGHLRGLDLPTKPHKPIHVFDKPNRPQPRIDSWIEKGMAVAVGRLRLHDDKLNYVVVGNNLLRGAAGIAVLIAEYIYKKELF